MHERVAERPGAGKGLSGNNCVGAAAAGRTAAFYDLDGTLARGNVLTHYLYFALTDATISGKALRLAGAAIRAPLFVALERLDRRAFNEAFYRSYAGLSEDRLAILGAELFERVVKPAIFSGARDLVRADARAGHLAVLVTGALDLVAEPLARHLGIDRWAANRLAIGRDGNVSGERVPPVLAGPGKAQWVRRFAAEEGIDLERSRAYADDAADLPFLSAVGRPVAVRPDARLRATALSHGWPVIDLDAGSGRAGGRGTGAKLLDRALDGALSVFRMLEAKR